MPLDIGLYRQAIENTAEPFLVHDLEGRVVDANPAACDLLGYARESLLGLRIDEVDPAWTAEALGAWARHARDGGAVPREWLMRRQDGSDVPTDACISLIEGGSPDTGTGEPSWVFMRLFRDITARLRTEDELRADRRRLEDLVENIPVAAVLVRGDEVQMNREAELLTGYRSGELLDLQTWFSTLYPDRKSDVASLYRQDQAAGFPSRRQITLRRKDGELRHAEFAAYRAEDEDVEANEVWVIYDVTEQVRAEDELRRLRQKAEQERDYLREEVSGSHPGDGIVGESPAIRAVREQVRAVAVTMANVLVTGESGVGKELVARAIHDRSLRRERPLIRVNCASIPKELFESEFFGHAKGAFTGAVSRRIGRFELAEGGTLFLDEVGEIPLELQSKLLRVLQERAFERVGESTTRSVDVRIVAATNRDIQAEIEAGRFREDLYYRLGVFPIHVPPLRERGPDVATIAAHLVAKLAPQMGIEAPPLTPEDVEALVAYDWPGNVRELQNTLERALILCRAHKRGLQLTALLAAGGQLASAPVVSGSPVGQRILTVAELRQLEKSNIEAALEAARGKVAGPGGAAERLGMQRTTLTSRIKALGIER